MLWLFRGDCRPDVLSYLYLNPVSSRKNASLTETVFLLFIIEDALQKKANCTACGKQVNQFQRNSVYEHPALKVLICKVGKFKCTFHLFL